MNVANIRSCYYTYIIYTIRLRRHKPEDEDEYEIECSFERC